MIAAETSRPLNHLGLFTGIGGFELAARWAGWDTVAWCEWDKFCQTVLKYHFPNADQHSDIRKTDFTRYAGRVDVLTGGFPCQPYSTAGKRLGKEDERHLWPEMLRAIREVSPRWVVGENVRGLVNWSGGLVFDEVQSDLEAQGYEVIPFLLPAAGVDAPHIRDRIWFVAYRADARAECLRKSKECTNQPFNAANADRISREEKLKKRYGEKKCEQPSFAACYGDSANADRNGYKLRGLGEDQSAQDSSETIKRQRQRFLGNTGGAGESQDVAHSDSSRRRQLNLSACEGGKGYGSRFGDADVSNAPCAECKLAWDSRERRYGFADVCSDAANPASGGRIQEHGESKPRLLTQDVPDWRRFPTQPPVCGRNDGIPGGLAGITVSSHRRNSIKALGNAIVPQVALKIFNAINQYERSLFNQE